ncbi:hypothetical protein GTQ34_10565 [Muricauda sp. JGD-17]|uniref:Uncharacterized protein n=1 Tax=Flagellimonas ochracea TaxID=2696472 RepID=A0A964WY22_9FLAO|nr:hypothetical protein [Allomuricauda ochracea]NAY92363.1 hypothetical protein [Allomuricauda ochracea]
MIGEEKKENKAFLKKSVEYLEGRGFDNIKVDLSGHERPKSFRTKSGDVQVAADISATKNGRKYFFDISLKTKKPKLLKSKWLLLDTVARLKSNSFKIITTKGHLKFTDDLLNEVNLTNKEPIRI